MQWISTQPAYMVWLLLGLMLLATSTIALEPIVAAIGIAAIVTAIAALTVPSVAIQLLIWGLLSVAMAMLLRSFVPKQSQDLSPPSEGQVSATIPRGGVGEVSYEGSYWSARCQVSDVTLTAGETVYVVGRQGNTLIVLPIGQRG